MKIVSNSTDVSLSNVNHTFNTSSNTKDRDGHFYHKIFRVNTNIDDKFVKLTFTNIRELSSPSYNCEHGGFIVSELWGYYEYPIVYSPYCTQHGTEPLVNEVNTFHSAHPHLVLIIFSYTFQMDVDILFETTPCEGITNICNVFCGQFATNHVMRIGEPLNYVVLNSKDSISTCIVQLQVIKGCIKVQQVSDRTGLVCYLSISVKEGMIQTIFHLQNNFRQVLTGISNVQQCMILSKC